MNLSSEQNKDSRSIQNDTKSDYDIAVTIISTFTHTSRNSSASIIISREANDSYDDFIKIKMIAKRAIRVTKQIREVET